MKGKTTSKEVVVLQEQKSKIKGKRFYYAIMSLLLVACASTAAVAWFSSSVGDDYNYSQIPQVIESPDTLVPDNVPDVIPNEDPKTNPASSSITSKKPSAESTIKSTKTYYPKMNAPVFGEITLPFAMDKMVFSKTMQDWRAHSGVDIAAELGAGVKAVADGVVEAVISDPRFGRTVIINHGGNVRSIYSNLAANVPVTTGQKVKQNSVIGSVGDTAQIESMDKTHLHFEVSEKRLPVNPVLHITFKN